MTRGAQDQVDASLIVTSSRIPQPSKRSCSLDYPELICDSEPGTANGVTKNIKKDKSNPKLWAKILTKAQTPQAMYLLWLVYGPRGWSPLQKERVSHSIWLIQE